jgi:hypothetical protein
MGQGVYDVVFRASRSEKLRSAMGYSYEDAPSSIFSSTLNSKMSPVGIDLRESRDSDEHPQSYPIIIALDVTGSMGQIPLYLIQKGLPKIMSKVIDSGISHPQLLFVGIGDSHYDKASLQVGQFESSDELLDYWLQNLWLEAGGGGNNGEDYLLAHHFATYHTVTDSWEKRQTKGVLITIGDEHYLDLENHLLTENVYKTPIQVSDSKRLIEECKEKYNVYHIHTNNRVYQGEEIVADRWVKLLGEENVIVQNDKTKIPDTVVDLILKSYNKQPVYNDTYSALNDTSGITAKQML